MIAAVKNASFGIWAIVFVVSTIAAVFAWSFIEVKMNPPTAESVRANKAANYYISCLRAKDPSYEDRFGGGTKWDGTALTSHLLAGTVTYETLDEWLEEEGCQSLGYSSK